MQYAGAATMEHGIDVRDYWGIVDCGDVSLAGASVAQLHQLIESTASEILAGGAIPIMCGGDHSIPIPGVRALTAHRQARLGYLHIDAHLDTAEDLAGSPDTMASPISRVVEMPGVNPENVVIFGARGLGNPPALVERARDLGVRVIPMSEIARRGVDAAIEDALDTIWSGTEAVYVSLDNDSLDPSCAPGTTAPEPGGLTARELLHDRGGGRKPGSGDARYRRAFTQLRPQRDHRPARLHLGRLRPQRLRGRDRARRRGGARHRASVERAELSQPEEPMTDTQIQPAVSEVQAHPSIPDDELRRRPGALGRALAEAGFDGWIAFGDDRAVYGPDHIRFLADIEPHFEPVFLAGKTDSSAALLLTGPETIGYAAVVTARAAISEIVAMEELSHPEEEYPTISLTSGFEALRELLAGAKRIAVIGMDAVAHPVWQRPDRPARRSRPRVRLRRRRLLSPAIDQDRCRAGGDRPRVQDRSGRTRDRRGDHPARHHRAGGGGRGGGGDAARRRRRLWHRHDGRLGPREHVADPRALDLQNDPAPRISSA